jgi:hypothetical protein
MGADIHMYVEYRNKKQAKERDAKGEKPYWMAYGRQVNPGRNYVMFAILASVRGDYPESFQPKGKLPKDHMSWTTSGDAYMYIYDKKDEGKDWEGFVTLKKAKEWEKYGCKIINRPDGTPAFVEHPDFHSHSWMSIEELEQAYKIYTEKASKQWGEEITRPHVEWMALLASMKALEGDDENEVRVVFWFDN